MLGHWESWPLFSSIVDLMLEQMSGSVTLQPTVYLLIKQVRTDFVLHCDRWQTHAPAVKEGKKALKKMLQDVGIVEQQTKQRNNVGMITKIVLCVCICSYIWLS